MGRPSHTADENMQCVLQCQHIKKGCEDEIGIILELSTNHRNIEVTDMKNYGSKMICTLPSCILGMKKRFAFRCNHCIWKVHMESEQHFAPNNNGL